MNPDSARLKSERALPKAGRATERFLAVRKRSEQLAEPLSPEDMVVQSMTEASPAKWNLAHTTWFFETFILLPHEDDYKVFDKTHNFLFNSYYEQIGERQPRPKRGLLTRPPLSQVMAYRRHVDAAIEKLIDSRPEPEILKLLELGCQHEEQHQELFLTDLLHAFSFNPLKPAYFQNQKPPKASLKKMAFGAIPEGLYEIGHEGKGFHFDCEGPKHKVYLEAFSLANRPISNGEFLEFIRDKGYETPTLWLSDGWDWVREKGARHPIYWRKSGDGWQEFSLYGEHPLDRKATAKHLSYYEADAFARWAGARLPTEAELEVVALKTGQQEAGEVWEWTSSAFGPYPGFKAEAGAVGEYNGKFMVGQQVLRGGSLATPKGHWRPSYRNFFYPYAQWQFTGVRLAR